MTGFDCAEMLFESIRRLNGKKYLELKRLACRQQGSAIPKSLTGTVNLDSGCEWHLYNANDALAGLTG